MTTQTINWFPGHMVAARRDAQKEMANIARPMKIDVAMLNSFGFGGTNSTLTFERMKH